MSLRHALGALALVLFGIAAPALTSAGGLTIITHGYRPHDAPQTTPAWLITMAAAIRDRTPTPNQTSMWYFRLGVDPEQGGVAVLDGYRYAGPDITDPGFNGEQILIVDWQEVAGWFPALPPNPYTNTYVVASVLRAELVFDYPTWLQQPIHLIGHSRGSSVMVELAALLAESGLWVDHVTMLDAHPLDGLNVDCLLDDIGDAPMSVSSNVVFAESYYRQDQNAGDDMECNSLNCDPDGRMVSDSFNVPFAEQVFEAPGYCLEHNDVHLWYFGTVDVVATGNGEATLGPDLFWYPTTGGNSIGPRGSSGFNWGRIARGQPWADPAREGYHFALGGAAARPEWSWTSNALWPNALRPRVLNGAVFSPGDQVQLETYYFQRSGGATIQFYLDTDENPHNGAGDALGPPLVANPTPAGPHSYYPNPVLGLPNIGTRYVVARILDTSERTRYAYASEPIVIRPVPARGDLNCDSAVDFFDIDPFLLALFDPAGYAATYPDCRILNADLNDDGSVDFFDIDPFLACLFAGGCENVPPGGMVNVPAGEFMMGNSFAAGEGGSDERPRHAVYVDAFLMDVHEVTNAEYAAALNWALDQDLVSVINNVVYKSNSGTTYPYCNTQNAASFSGITWNGTTFAAVADKQNHPMVEVSWYGAAAFCNWRSAMQGLPPCYDVPSWSCDFDAPGFRLPTEAEWEKAARGGADGRRFPWSDQDTIQHARCNYDSSATYSYDTSPTRGVHPLWDGGTSPRGFFDGSLQLRSDWDWPDPATSYQTANGANGYGLYDMAGNAWEWCNDRYSNTYYTGLPFDNPTGPAAGPSRVWRGGGWGIGANNCRVANRDHGTPEHRANHHGFRCSLGIP